MTCPPRTSPPGSSRWPAARSSSTACAPDAALTLLNVSENATYAVDDPATGERTVLRVHRHGYHDGPEIESELAWLDALRDDTGVRTPTRAAHAGRPAAAGDAGGGRSRPAPRGALRVPARRRADAERRASLPASFELLGGITARMHEHALTWQRPPGFTRFAWDYDGAFGSVGPLGALAGRHGDRCRRSARCSAGWTPRCGPGWRASAPSPHRYGLVHADLRLANLLEDGDEAYVIDFDDCGFSWFLYDFGTAVSFFEDDPRVPELTDAWVRGYRSVRDLPAEDEAEIPTFVLMRRLLLVAWIGSHSGTDLARSMGADYTAAQLRPGRDLPLPLRLSRRRHHRGGRMFTPLKGRGGHRHRRQQGHRQGHRPGLRARRAPTC